MNFEKIHMHIRKMYVFFAIFFVIFTIYNASFEFEHSITYIQDLSYSSVFLCIGLVTVSYLLRACRWLMYVRIVDKNPNAMHHVWIYYSGFAFTVSPGKAGELMRSFFMKQLSIPFEYSFGCFVSERFLDVISVILLGGFFFQRIEVSTFFILVVFSLLPIFIRKFVLIAICFFCDKKRHHVFDVVLAFWKTSIAMRASIISILAWLSQGLILFFVLNEMGISINWSLAVSMYCLSLLIGALSLIPGGIGATELAMSWLLVQVGIDAEVAAGAALVTRSLTLLPSLALGLIASYILRKCYCLKS